MEEITLRDIYLLYRRWRFAMLGMVLGGALLGFVLTLLQPKVFESKGILALSLVKDDQHQAQQTQIRSQELFANMPTLPGLVQGFESALESGELLSTKDATLTANAKYDEVRGTLELTGQGPDAQTALETTKQAVAAAGDFVRAQIAGAFRSNLAAKLARLRFDRDVAHEGLTRLIAVSKQTSLAGNDATIAAGLEARQVDPQAARSNNPGVTSLRLEQVKLQTELAQSEAMISVLGLLERDSKRLEALTGQAFQVQTLAAPSLSVAPASPRTGLTVGLAAMLGVMLALVVPVVLESLRDPAKGSAN